jgi:hypothetical protein
MIPRAILKAKAFSSHGELTFDAITGFVLERELYEPQDDGAECLKAITRFDVIEWRSTYPGEEMGEHDILDLGYFFARNGREGYEPPDHGWRADREDLRREHALDHGDEYACADCGRTFTDGKARDDHFMSPDCPEHQPLVFP